jgi:hypothetical protein
VVKVPFHFNVSGETNEILQSAASKVRELVVRAKSELQIPSMY